MQISDTPLRFHRANLTSARYPTPVSKYPPTSAYGTNAPIAIRIGAGQRLSIHAEGARPLSKSDSSGISQGVSTPLTIEVPTPEWLGVSTADAIENQTREVKRDRKPEWTPESKGESIGGRTGDQLPNKSLDHQRVHIAHANRVRKEIQLPVGTSAGQVMCTGVCGGKHLWFKYAIHAPVATQASTPVYMAVSDGYSVGDD